MNERDAYYCNLKFILLFLVVFGHWIEPYISCAPWVTVIYRVIYTVHMPLFIFLSGTFLNSGDQMKSQTRRAFIWYLAAQATAVLVSGISGSPLTLHRPYWHLWYLLSLSQWSFLCCGLERWGRLPRQSLGIRLGVILLAVIMGCGAGYVPWINRNLSLSRTLVFFPYLLAGRLCPKEIFRGKYLLGFAALAGFGVTYHLCGPYLPTSFLYQADPYGALEPFGVLLRLSCYLMGGLLGVGILALTPGRRFSFSRIGADTLGIYLYHAPVIGLFRLLPLSPLEMIAVSPFASLWMIGLLCEVFRWRGQLYTVRWTSRKVNGS